MELSSHNVNAAYNFFHIRLGHEASGLFEDGLLADLADGSRSEDEIGRFSELAYLDRGFENAPD